MELQTYRENTATALMPDESLFQGSNWLALIMIMALVPLIHGGLPKIFKSKYLISSRFDAKEVNIEKFSPETSSPKNFIIPKFHSYNFHKVTKGFDGQLKVARLSEIAKQKLRFILLEAVPNNLKRRASRLIDWSLDYSQTYNVDPVWILSIMWTESHFQTQIQSPAKALGPMQLMPGTAEFLVKQVTIPKEILRSYRDIRRVPRYNIHLGVYYLRYLLDMFQGNYKLATVAYNMGPYWVRNRIKNGGPVGVKNLYLQKVTKAYQFLSSPLKQLLAQRPVPYKDTFVFKSKPTLTYITYQWQEFSKIIAEDKNSISKKENIPYLSLNIGQQQSILSLEKLSRLL